ncbi:high mobility group protein B1-like [Prionailurus iriomotensis]
MSSYAFFVQTCREEHKKKHPDASVNFSEFSKKCSERWKTMSAKEKGKFEDMAKADKARYEREMKTYIPPKGETKKKFKDPNAPQEASFRPFSCFVLSIAQKSKENILAYPLVMLQRNWERCGITPLQMTSSLMRRRLRSLKEKYEKDIAAYRAKGKPDAAKKGVVKAEKSKKKKEEEEDEEDEEDEEEEEDEEDEEEEEDDDDE